ncbi:solute carrier family 22 member 15-like isoform X3 [Rhopilema esculentum]|uniref:solute carrier family 22 member 15-like isoform X3 n=1 Tax=Rhopilema esculentum TaxID=499914 RepID=UPI0031DC084B
MDCKPKASLKLDDILPLIGEFGKFQILFDIVLCFMQAPGIMLLFLPYFSQHSPSWRCMQNSTNCALNGSISSDSPDFGKRCNMSRADWEFTELKSYSIVTQFDIVCDKTPLVHLGSSLIFVSWAVGAVILGWISDRLVPESARWLIVNGKPEELVEILTRIAKMNGKEVPAIGNIEVTKEPTEGLKHFIYLFTPKQIAISSLVQGFAWVVNGLVYYGVSFAADDLGGSMYRDFLLSTLAGICAAFAYSYFSDRLGRKKTVIVPMVIAGVACIAVSFISKEYAVTRVVLGIIGKFCITLSFDAIYTWSLELYPTTIRGVGMGYLQIAARIGSALAPWIAKQLKVVNESLPFALMGGMSFISALFLLVLPETVNEKTRETIEDQLEGNASKKAEYEKEVMVLENKIKV